MVQSDRCARRSRAFSWILAPPFRIHPPVTHGAQDVSLGTPAGRLCSQRMTDMPASPHAVKELAGKVAVVTGASGGIGSAILRELAAAGADCVAHTHSKEGRAHSLAEDARRLGVDVLVVPADLSTDGARGEFVERCHAWKGTVQILVNNAGADVLTGDARHWPFHKKLDLLWNLDVAATIHLGREFGRRMKASGEGVILNMGWDQACQGMAGDSGELFAAAKGAVMCFSRSLAHSLAPQVRVNCLAPGWIRTAWGENASAFWQERAVNESLLNRWGTPEDVARVAAFLASGAASFVNGQVIPINGGFRHGIAR